MKRKITSFRLKIRHFVWLLAAVLVLSLIPGVFHFWQGFVNLTFLIFWILVLLIIGVLFVFGLRFAQKDSFLDGYTKAKDDFDKEKKS